MIIRRRVLRVKFADKILMLINCYPKLLVKNSRDLITYEAINGSPRNQSKRRFQRTFPIYPHHERVTGNP
jgi:hypothetical protein